MIRTKTRLILCLTLLFVNLAFIWGNSLLSADVSVTVSQPVQDVLTEVLPSTPKDPDSVHDLLRKLAHFAEFSTLGALLGWLFAMLLQKKWQQLVLPLLCGVFAACVDETIQFFVPGRGPGIKDVGIDILGVMLGIVIIYFISKKTKLKYLEEQTL